MSVEKQNNNFEVHIHDQKEYEKFKDFAKSKGKEPKELLYEIHKKMGVSKNEIGHFGPKTIRYLEKKIYKEEKLKEVTSLSKKTEYQDVIDNNQAILDNLNLDTKKLLDKNNQKVKNDIFKFSGKISVGFGYENLFKGDKYFKQEGFQWTGNIGEVAGNNISNYMPSNEVKNLVEYNKYLNEIIVGIKNDMENYWDFWSNLYEKYEKGDITYGELVNLDRDKWQQYLENKNLLYEKSGELDINNEIINKHKELGLSKYTTDLLDGIRNQRTKKDIKEDKELFEILSGASDIDTSQIDTSQIDTKTTTPLDIWKEKYENASVEDKINMARVISAYMAEFGYDLSMVKKLKTSDVKSEDMWATYKEGGVAGVCRHHASEVAKFLESVGIISGTISTNSSGVRHVITMGKLENGKYFFIDDGDYFESKDFLGMKAKYLSQKGSVDFQEWLTKANGDVIKIIKTALEQKLESNSSSIGTGSSTDYSKQLAKNGIILVKGVDVNSNITNNSKAFDIKVGKETKYGHYEIGAFYRENQNIDYANLQSFGAYLKGKWGDRTGEYGELGAGLKIARHNIDWNNGNKAQYNTLGLNLDWSKNLLKTSIDEVNLGVSSQLLILADETNRKGEAYSYVPKINSFGKLQDFEANLGATLDWKHKFSENLIGNFGVEYGAEFGIKNLRGNDLTLHSKYGVYGGADYKKGDLLFGGKLFYEKGLGYKKYGVEGHLRKGEQNKKGTLDLNLNYTKEKDTTKFKFDPKVEKSIGIKYNVTDTLKVGVYGFDNNNMGQKNSGGGIEFEYKF